jgi:hypothetical protein
MEELLGMKISQYDGCYELVLIKPFEEEFSAMRKVAEETGKYPAYFYFQKILKSGKKSKQGFFALMFKNNKQIVKI